MHGIRSLPYFKGAYIQGGVYFICGRDFVFVFGCSYLRETCNWDIMVWHKFKLPFVGLLKDGFL